jgi:hypothetical protein
MPAKQQEAHLRPHNVLPAIIVQEEQNNSVQWDTIVLQARLINMEEQLRQAQA